MTYWFDPIVGGANGPGGAGLQNAYASQAQINNWNAQQAATLAAANSFNPWANTPGGFGGLTNYYSALGAAHGRATGGFGTPGSNPGWQDPQPPDDPEPVPSQHLPGSTWVDPTPGAGAGAGYYANGFRPDAYLTSNPDVARYAVEHGMDPNKFAEEHAMTRGVMESRSGAEPFGNPFTWGNQAGGGVLHPFGGIDQANWYAGLGGDAFGAAGNPYEPLYQTPFNERLLGPDQTPDIDFDERWGDTPNTGGRPFQQEYEDYFQQLTAPQRQRAGALESYFEHNPDVWQAAKTSGRGMLGFGAEHLKAYGEDEGRELFNPVQYLRQNEDVRKAGMDAWQHYDRFGRNEGREATWGNVFNPDTYLMNNQDVAQAGVDPRTHWLQYGQYEGRQGGVDPGDVFNADVYKRLNPDVAQAGVDPLTHWQQFGRDEGRQGAGSVETDRDSVARTLLAREMLKQYGQSPVAAAVATHPGNPSNQPSSGYIGIQSPVMQDPFGGYRSQSDLDASGGFPANYQQGFRAAPGFDPNWQDPFQTIPGG